MELKAYFRVILKYWWIVLPAFAVTLVAAIVFTKRQPTIYDSSATYVVTPSPAFENAQSFASGLDTLSRRTEIATTYGHVATSRTILTSVVEELGLTPEIRETLSIRSRQVAGTNILEVTVEAQSPTVARDVADTVGTETIEFTKSLYEPYVLKPLDAATFSNSPIGPSRIRNYFLGAVFGLVLGAGLAFMASYLDTPQSRISSANIIDSDTGAFSEDFFMQRLGEEMARARRQDYALSVAMLNVDQLGSLTGIPADARAELLRKATMFLDQYLREEDLVSHFSGATFAILLPDLSKDAAQALAERLQARIAWTPFELERSGLKINLSSAIGVAALDRPNVDRDELIKEATEALQRSEVRRYDQTYLATEDLVADSRQSVETS